MRFVLGSRRIRIDKNAFDFSKNNNSFRARKNDFFSCVWMTGFRAFCGAKNDAAS